MTTSPHRLQVNHCRWCWPILLLSSALSHAKPYLPADGEQVLADIPASARHVAPATRELARNRLDVALRLAQLYITQSRATGDLRFLGYAESVLQTWLTGANASADALVLQATLLQSRHEFSAALMVIDQALQLRADDVQAWLTRATILRVLGRYPESLQACAQVAARAADSVTQLCTQSLRSLMGELPTAYTALSNLSSPMPSAQRAWRDSELGEMAVRLGNDADAEHWFKNGLKFAPEDFYLRAAYADLLIRQQRAAEALTLLNGQDSIEPLLLRIAIAQKMLRQPQLKLSRTRLAATFATEMQRHEGIHRREQARFLLDVEGDAQAALQAAQDNWQVQHETDDLLILIRAAHAAGLPDKAAPAIAFVREHGLQDARITAAMDSLAAKAQR